MSELICPFTKLPLTNYDPYRYNQPFVKCTVKIDDYNYIEYTVDRAAFTEWQKDQWFIKNGYLVEIAFRKRIELFSQKDFITLNLVKQRVEASIMPHTPKMKLDYLLKYIDQNTSSQGKALVIKATLASNSSQSIWAIQPNDIYFKDQDELIFYARTLAQNALVTLTENSDPDRILGYKISLALTYDGLNYLAGLEVAGSLSKNCFVAMSFDPSRQLYREAIERAIRYCGYEPIMIDTRHIDSDKTINDRIIAEIRACKFCVSDFTGQRNGVYFEAGFALGLGKAIIYMCETKDFLENSHFDLKPFQHILYNTVEELEGQLKAKIDAWIQ
jgi:nucleoside 2-deoxyribosyltransferase